MNITEEAQNKDQQAFNDNYSKEFTSFLGAGTFTPESLATFCKNTLYIEHTTTPQDQLKIKIFLSTFADRLNLYYKDEEKARSFLAGLYKSFPNKHVKGWDSFRDSVILFDDSRDYKSRVFYRRFPIGTISYIGARPGRGKTTMLVNIAIDALEQKKPVVFVTAEETTKQILTRFILSYTYLKAKSDDARKEYANFPPRTKLYNYMKDTARNLPGVEVENSDFFGPSCDLVKEAIDSKRLTIFEAYGASWEEMTAYLKDQEAGTVVLIDYIQHLKTPERFTTQTRQIQIQEVSHQLADLAGLYGLIMLSGAQFNRAGNNTNSTPDLTKPDRFDESSFREAGDIEQDGHILIGIGKNPTTEELFYSCMKDREASPDNGNRWLLSKNMAYSFLTGKKDEYGQPVPYVEQNRDDPPNRSGSGKRGKGKEQTEEEKEEALIKAFQAKNGGNK